MENVDTKLPRKGFYHYGRLVPQYHHMHRYMPVYMNDVGLVYYSLEQLRRHR
jgi:hypothetical protein